MQQQKHSLKFYLKKNSFIYLYVCKRRALFLYFPYNVFSAIYMLWDILVLVKKYFKNK